MTKPCYIDLEQARQVLAEMGVELTARQMKRAAELDVHELTIKILIIEDDEKVRLALES